MEDDRSDRHTFEALLPGVAARCDLSLGPYSTQLMRTAGRMGAESGWLVWNHGGSGDDVEGAYPGHVISVLTPASRYAEPFLRHIASERGAARELCIVHGAGSFGRQVADGAETIARQLGTRTVRAAPGDQLPPSGVSREWDLFSAGVFEQDTETVGKAQRLPVPPRRVCAVAVGVRGFSLVNGHEEIRSGGRVISWLAVTGYPGGWPAFLPAGCQGMATTPFPARASARRWESPAVCTNGTQTVLA
jgi:hypothetical protein